MFKAFVNLSHDTTFDISQIDQNFLETFYGEGQRTACSCRRAGECLLFDYHPRN